MIRHLLRPLAAVFALVANVVSRADVTINEVMVQPAGIPENVALEFIELHNPGALAVDLSGWRFSKGAHFTFATGTVLPAGEYLVVAADVAAFQAAYPSVANVVGGWVGTLANGGERVLLEDASGIARDEVSYADEGDWALRVREAAFGGWAWSSAADGGGSSLELRNPALAHDCGQNWGASTVVGGTPGAANSIATTNLAPIIRKVRHFPVIPKSVESVTISCELADETAATGLIATLHWRDATTTGPGPFQSAAMIGDGAGNFAATLAPRANLAIVEFYVEASDGANLRTWPAPTSEGQNANCQYQVDNEVLNATDSYYRLILTAAENAAFNAVANTSDRQFNQTLVVTRGGETTVRYRGAMRIRGNSSRNYQFRPLRVSVPSDEPWDGVTAFAINPRSPHLQFLGMRLMQAAGVRAADAIPVELRRNGIESTTSTGATPDFGKFVRIEDLGSEFIDHHWPYASGGNAYKKVRPDRYWRNTGWVVPPNADGTIDGWLKQNNASANDWSDLTSFFATVQTVTAPHFPGAPADDSAGSTGTPTTTIGAWAGTAFSGEEIATLETVADLDQWARWFAVMTIIQDIETNISNGEDDDYAVYFQPSAGGQRRMQLLAHDLDTIFGLGDNPIAANGRGLYDMCQTGSIFRPLLPLFGNSITPGNAAFRAKYHTAIRELYGSLFDADTTANPTPAFHTFVDNHLGGWVPEATRTAIKTFATDRQAHLLGLIGAGALPPVEPTASASFGRGHGPVMISEVLARNVAAVNVGGAFPDFVELHNAGAAPVSLAGRSLSDDPAQPRKYVFPAGTTLAPGAHLVLYADGGTAPGHLPFALRDEGEGVYFYEAAVKEQPLLDAVVFGPQVADFSVGRTGPGLTKWTLGPPTPGAANTTADLAPLSAVRINEWLGNPDYQFDDDFLELHNVAALPVALGGTALTDDFINDPAKHVLPPLSFIGPAACLRFDADALGFGIDGTFGSVALLGQNGALADRVEIVAQPADVSSGRTPDGTAATARFGLPSALATPGEANAPPPAEVLALMNGLRVTEILYAPDAIEFVELQNTSASSLDLGGVHFTRGITYTFAAGTTLAPGAFLVVCRDRAAFQAQFGTGVPLAPGTYSGALSNNGERLALEPAAPWDADILNFDYSTAWYPATNAGRSLTVISPATARPGDWDEKETWTASPAQFGSPGTDGPPVITSATNAAGIAGDAFTYQIVAAKNPTSYDAAPLPAGLSVDPGTGLISGTLTAAGTFTITLTATNLAGSGTATLTLNVATSGPLARFVWSAIASPQPAGAPFAANLTAQDAQGRTVTTFAGAAGLTAASSAGSSATVVITEVGENSPDYFEIQNVSDQPVNTTGWFVTVNNATLGNPNTVHTATWPLPAATAAGQVLYSTDAVADNYFGENINWNAALPGWVMLVDNVGVIRDFVAWGYSTAQIASISFVKNTFTLSPSAQNAWSGAGVGLATATTVHLRTGNDDTHAATDWTTGVVSRGAQNAGLTVPFTGPTNSVPVAPASVTFAAGLWSGSVTIGTAATNVRLTANDGAGHVGVSNAFTTTPVPAPSDADGDGLADAWELAFGLDPNDATDATHDADGDGQSNRAEWLAGTAPDDPAARLRILATALVGGDVRLTWSSVPGRRYRILTRADLASGAWLDLTPAPLVAADTTCTWTHAGGTSAASRYYRVEIVP